MQMDFLITQKLKSKKKNLKTMKKMYTKSPLDNKFNY